MKNAICCLLLLVSFLGKTQSIEQQVIGTTGGHSTSANSQLDWTMGETIISTQSNNDNILTQGFHQTRLNITSVDDFADQIKFEVFPNPTPDKLVINGSNLSKQYSIKVYSTTGSLLQTHTYNMLNNTLDFSAYERGQYLVVIETKDLMERYTFRIIKT